VLKKLILFCALAGFLFLVLSPTVYLIRGSGGAMLFWNSNEALLFTIGANDGARMSVLRYSIDPLIETFGGARRPDDAACSESVVVKITDQGVTRYDTELFEHYDEGISMRPTVYNGQIFFGYLVQDNIWRWSGERFEHATPEELKEIHAERYSAIHSNAAQNVDSIAFDNIDGWSMRVLGNGAPKQDFVINGRNFTIRFSDPISQREPLTVNLVNPDQSVRTIWTFEERSHRVGRMEYEHTFAKH
jgi:hypothetical protein